MKLAIATGGFEESCIIKLHTARIDIGDAPIASSNDSMARERIIELAIQRARKSYGVDSFEHIVYVGDGVWDVKAARACKIGFLGIGHGEDEQKLREEGAQAILPHFEDQGRFIEAIQTAPVPEEK